MQINPESLHGRLYLTPDLYIVGFVSAGGQSVIYEGVFKGQKVAVAAMKNEAPARLRLAMHERLAGISDIVHVLAVFETQRKKHLTFKISKGHADQFSDLLHAGQLLVVYEWVSYPEMRVAKSGTNLEALEQIELTAWLKTFRQVMHTVEKMHKLGVFHLDLKPENILMTTGAFKIIDLGSAQLGDEHVHDEDPLFFGTEPAAVICQATAAFSSVRFDAFRGLVRCAPFDCYSLGSSLYTALTGQIFNADDVMQMTETIFREVGFLLGDLILGLTDRDPGLRYTLAEALRHPVFSSPCPVSRTSRDAKTVKTWRAMRYYSMIDAAGPAIRCGLGITRARSAVLCRLIQRHACLRDDSDQLIMALGSQRPLDRPLNINILTRFTPRSICGAPISIALPAKLCCLQRHVQLQFQGEAQNIQITNFIDNTPLAASRTSLSHFTSSSSDFAVAELDLYETSDGNQAMRCTSRTISRGHLKRLKPRLSHIATKQNILRLSDEGSQTNELKRISISDDDFVDIFEINLGGPVILELESCP